MTLREKIAGLNPAEGADAMKIAQIMCEHNYLRAKEEYTEACKWHIAGTLTDQEFQRLADIYTSHMAKMLDILDRTAI